jgi:predicted transcriptional regulator
MIFGPAVLTRRGILSHSSSVNTHSGAAVQARLDAIGITKLEFAERAKIDRGTLNRVLADDPTVTART